jgi:2-C-methyl-D-erythritol 4-phosphate cytidylyltransferase
MTPPNDRAADAAASDGPVPTALPLPTFPIGALPRCFALVPCAGSGSRSGSFVPKQYAPLGGDPLVAHTLDALAEVDRIEATLVVLAPDDDVFDEELPGFQGERGWTARVGGASRAETVLNGLQVLRERGVQPHDWVLVHDAARCLVRPAWIERLIDACEHDEVGGLLALPVPDTLKAGDADLPPPVAGGAPAPAGEVRVARTVARDRMWAAQTPQMFRLGLLEPALRRALAADPAGVTDEASAIEAAGHAPRLVRGEAENLKVTYREDFAFAERLLATSRRAAELRPVLPVADLALAELFYTDMGFQKEFSRGGIAGFKLGQTQILLRAVDAAATPTALGGEPLTIHLTLGDLDRFWHRIDREGLAQRYVVACEPPVLRAWGLKEMLLHDPSGNRWRISERLRLPE